MAVTTTVTRDRQTLQTVRRVLGVVLLIAFAGVVVELLLLEHDDDPSQLIPLVLLGAAAPTLILAMIRPRAPVVSLFRLLMALLVAAGMLGVGLHFRANVEFQRELTPGATVAELFWKVMAAKTPPPLAPAVMAQLGLLGFVYAYRLPVGRSRPATGEGGE